LTFPPSGWQFDSSTLISFCADTSGDPSYYCSINEFKYWLGNPTDFYGYIRNVNRNLLWIFLLDKPLILAYLKANYRLTEGTGSQIYDSTVNAKIGYLGSDSGSSKAPTWLSTVELFSALNFIIIIKGSRCKIYFKWTIYQNHTTKSSSDCLRWRILYIHLLVSTNKNTK